MQTSRELDSFVEVTHRPATLTELLDQRALQCPDKPAYTFLLDGETNELHLTYRELQRRARAIGAALEQTVAKGARALLLYPPGLDFIEGFFGCLYAGVVAIPAYPPHFAKLNRGLPRLQSILADAQAALVLTTSSILEKAKPIFTDLHWHATDTVVNEDWQQPQHTKPDDLAFLQYTSGSTGHPRGVMLTHANLLHNASLIFHVFEHTANDSYVSWLPMFHDMGFMVGVLQPLYAGIRAVVMSPVSFLQRPARWLDAISRYRATTSGGPNFAYDLCARKITADDAAKFDLSSWTVAFNGAEPVRAETLDRFAARFESCGFRRSAFYPCYGLAEATLVVTGGRKRSLPVIKQAGAKLMVGCGGQLPGERVIIVDPASLTEFKDGQVGEIWVYGPSVARGYWNRPEETLEIFNAYLSDTGEGPFLRTEDLGFIEDGELYITGRIKDLIIIRGLNHYPQDIEWTVERCHAALRPGCGAAFTVEAGSEERLVIVQEIDARKEADLDKVIETIREAVAAEHELQVYAVALIKPGAILKTSSGKIQRRASREKFLEGTLEIVAGWRATASDESDAPEFVDSSSEEAINSWLLSLVAARLGIAGVQMDQPLARYGLDSLAAIELTHSIETSLGVILPMVSFLQGSSIRDLSAQIYSQLSDPAKLRTGQVRKRGLPPLAEERGQGPLPDLFCSADYAATQPLPENLQIEEQARKRGMPPLAEERGQGPLPDLFCSADYAATQPLPENLQIEEQARKRGMPPLAEERGQGPLPDLFCSADYAATQPLPENLQIEEQVQPSLENLQIKEQVRKRGLPPLLQNENEYPLSYGQRGLWFLHNLAPESVAYNIARAVKIRAALDVTALRRAFAVLVDRHAALRTTFTTSRGDPVQQVAARVEPHFQAEDARHWSEAQLEKRLTEESERPFDLVCGPLLRINLFTRSDNEHILLLAAHHIIIDFWSLALLMQELGLLYEAEHSALPALSSSYSAFVYWQRELLSSEEGEKHWTYWRSQLSGELPILDLPVTRPRPPVQTFRGSSESLRLNAATVRRLKTLSREHDATLFVMLLAAFQAMLHRYTGQDELLVGSVTAGRTRAEFAPLVGYFVNPLVLRARVSGDDSFESLLAQVRRIVLEAFAHQDFPFSTLVERLQAARDPSRSPLFQVMFSMHKAHAAGDEALSLFALGEAGARMNLGRLEMESVPLKRRVAQFDLTLMMAEVGEDLYATFEYNTDLFDAAMIRQMAESFQTLLDAVVANPVERISRLPLLDTEDFSRKGAKAQREPSENAVALCAFAPLREKYFLQEQTIHQLFERQVAATPEAVAIVFGEQQLSYRELNQRANKLARHLQRLGVGPESLVAIYIERSAEMVVGLLAILKAGGAYVPLDTSYPQERIAFLLDDAGVEVIVTQSSLLAQINRTKAVCIDRDWQEIERESDDNLEACISPDNAAYVIYTSGSTGRPKGVVVTHHNVLRLFAATKTWFEFSHRDVWALFHSYAFDFSVWELWGALLHGGRLVVVPYFVSRTPEAFRELLRSQGVTVLNQTPSAFRQLMFAEPNSERLTDLRLVIFGGEALELQTLRPWLERYGDERPQLVNMYGITETTVHVTYRRIRTADLESGRRSVIGTAIPDLQVYILDQHQQRVPPGVVGELCVAGDGLARGYLHQPQLTAERFLPDINGARLYRSGDLGRQLTDGEIEYLGRIDQQVKVRGFRVEPGEIEATLNEHTSVRESVVVAREEMTGDKRLVAYVVARAGEPFSPEDLRSHLQQRLPEYMLPAVIVQIERLPLTLNGKIDRRALPPLDEVAVRPNKIFESPRTDTEKTLAAIWSEVLGINSVGVNDNFFELGGDSILSIQIVARAKEAGIYVTPQQLFQHQTIAELARLSGTPPEVKELEPARLDQRQLEKLAQLGSEIEDTYPLTPMQQGILFHSLSEPDSGVYTTQFVCELRGDLDEEAFETAWQEVTQRHQSLRTDFAWDISTEPVQVVRRSVEVKLNREDWSGVSRARQDELLEEYLRRDRERGFDFKRAPLLRLALLGRSHEECIFVFSHHHLLIDGWSLSIILQEVFAIYDAGKAVRLRESRSFKDYVAWLGGQDQAAAESFWRETLNGFTEPTSLGIDNLSDTEGYCEESLYLSETSTESLQAFARQNQLTLSTLVYGAWSILLSRYSGERDIVFGVTSSGRPPDLSGSEAMVGLFINTLPLRVRVPSGQLLIPWLRSLQDRLVEMRQYEYSALAQVQEWSDVPRGRALFESIFVFENYPVDTSLAGRHDITGVRSIEQTNYPLTIAAEPGAPLALYAGYKKDRFDTAAISRMLRHLETLLEGMIAHPEQRLSNLSLLSAGERDLLVREWNDTRADFADLCLHELFEQQVAATPDGVALIFEDERLSYDELNHRANKLAHYLRGLGIGRGKLVGICLERGPEMIISMLAILKAGAAYLPLDPQYPKERLAYMLADAQPELVVTEQVFETRKIEQVRKRGLPPHSEQRGQGPLPDLFLSTVCLDTEVEGISQQSGENLHELTSPEDLAYVIYTSGSTGEPKAVMISHKAISNHMQWFAREFPLVASDRTLLNHSISFDAALDEVFQPLITGAGLVIVPPDRQYDVDYLVHLIRAEQVMVLDFVPAMFKALLEDGRIKDCGSIRRAISSGEALSVTLKNDVYRLLPQVELANLYGPTEAAITATHFRCRPDSDERTVAIGRPVANTQVYILDENLEPLPPGIVGEIYIGGDGLAWGYLNRPQLTAEKFIPDPFSLKAGARLYQTGDLGRYSTDGNVEYVGRVDTQVKVRGFRIELGEIEAHLRNHRTVKDAVVILREEVEGEKRLIAYVVCHHQEACTPDDLRSYLKNELPEYMLPGAIVLLDALPLSGSGKVDVRALPAPEAIRTEADYVGPRTPVEQELARIWQEVLGLERVGITDNFFELGGDSIVSIQIVARARDAGLSITPKQVLNHASIAELAAVTTVSREPEAEAEFDDGAIPLTPIQRWFFEQQLPDPHHYNQAVMLEVKQPVSADLLKQTLEQLIEHHPALRLRFEHDGGSWKQTIAARETHETFTCITQLTEISEAIDKAQASLNLSDGPIIRAVYFRQDAQDSSGLDPVSQEKSCKSCLLIVIHHLAVDGVSWRILLDDLQRTYEQLQYGAEVKLPAKTLSFKRWSELLSAHAQSASVRQELEYWTAEPRRNIANLPVDYAGDNNTDSACSLSVSLSAEETRLLLQEVPRAYQTQINDVLLAALAQALSEWTQAKLALIDLEGHGREEIVAGCDLSRTVGWFTTIFPVLIEVSNSAAPGETLKSVKEQLRRAPNRGIGYGLLRYLSGDETQLKELPPAQVSFNYLGQLDQVLSAETTPFVLINGPVGQSRGKLGKRKYLIEIDGAVRDGRLELEWVYSNQIHARRTIEVLAQSFIRRLRKLIEHCVLRDVREYTPSDFPLAHLNERQLAQIQRTAGPIADLYPLSPMQEGMLFHSLYGSDSGIYTTQLVCELHGRLNPDIFERAWQATADAHAVLRTGFEWEAVEEPVQVVRRSVKVRLKRENWMSFSRREQEENLENYLRREREQEFDLKQSPLMRLAHVRTAADESLFIWTNHHLLLDGWSLPIVLKDVLTAYERLRRGEPALRKPERSYRDYIAWIKKQDLQTAESFWRRLLKGFKSPTPLPNHQLPVDSQYAEQQIQLSQAATAKLQRFAQRHQLTLNTLVQGAWALLLSSSSGSEDIVFGVVVSGRSAQVADVESIVGLFINTLPARATITGETELTVWLKELQAQQAEMSQYEYSPLARVQAWSEVEPGQALFESIFVFENYPGASATDVYGDLRVGKVRSIERSNYPLTVWAMPDRELVLRIGYDKRRFHKEWISQLLRDYQTLLEQIPEALWVKDLLPTKKHKTHKSHY